MREQLWKQQWTEQEKPGKIQRIVAMLQGHLEGVDIPGGRPELQAFQDRLGSIAGCAGADASTLVSLSTYPKRKSEFFYLGNSAP